MRASAVSCSRATAPARSRCSTHAHGSTISRSPRSPRHSSDCRGCRARPAPDAIARYLAHGFFAGGDSAFAALHALPPGARARGHRDREPRSRATGVRGTCRRRASDRRRATAHRRRRREILRDDARASRARRASRVPDEVPFGVFLSGGVDSGRRRRARRAPPRRFPTFSLGWTDHGLRRIRASRARSPTSSARSTSSSRWTTAAARRR